MPQQRDLYEVLGVDRSASDAEIRKAYLKLAHKFHPDKTGGDRAAEDKLKEINAAYDVLKNKEKRAQYDRYGHAGDPFGGGQGGGFGGGFAGGFEGGGFETPFEDLFDMLFGGRSGHGGGGGRRAARPGNDVEAHVRITLREAALGVKKNIAFNRHEACNECKGTGAAPGSKPEICPQCQGAGQVRMTQGFFSVTRPCPQCRGAGRIVANPCHRCRGAGQVRNKREIVVDIPAGVDSGSRLRVTGEGEPGAGGGPRGDLYVLIEVLPSEIFEREGSTIVCDVPVSFTQAALGATIRVPTLTGEAELKIAPGTQSGALLKLRGLGMPDLRGYRQGDQIVRIQVEVPQKLSRKQRELLEEFQQLSDAKSYPLHKRFLDQLKKFQAGKG